jgi:hypothetical protein
VSPEPNGLEHILSHAEMQHCLLFICKQHASIFGKTIFVLMLWLFCPADSRPPLFSRDYEGNGQ